MKSKRVVTSPLSEVQVKVIAPGLVELGIVGREAEVMLELTPDQADRLGPLLRDAAQEAREM